MGIKIKNLQTGEFEKFNIPALKGEKGEPGEIEPSEKVDYIGKQHSKLRDTMNANVDYIIKTAIDEFNYLDYEGQHITATNSIEGHAKSAILKGQTLVNTLTYEHTAPTSGAKREGDIFTLDKSQQWSRIHLLKSNPLWIPNETYTTILYDVVGDVSTLNMCSQGERVVKTPFNNNRAVFTMGVGRDSDNRCAYIESSTIVADQKVSFKVVVLKGDYSDVDVPYFEGMQSVKMPVLTTTGKNLFNKATITEGEEFYNDKIIKSENSFISDFINAQPNTAYTMSGKTTGNRVHIFDKDKNLIYHPKAENNVIIMPNDDRICYMKINGLIEETDTWQLEKGTQATAYEPYKSNILHTSEEVVLRSLPNGVCDTLNLTTGEYVQRIGEYRVTGGEEERYGTDGQAQYIYISNTPALMGMKSTSVLVCDKFPYHKSYSVYDYPKVSSTGVLIFVLPTSATGLSTKEEREAYIRNIAKTEGITVQYELATPIIKTVDLSDNHVYSYGSTTHYSCSSEEGSLVPTLSVKVPTDTQLTIQEQKATTQTLLNKNMDLQQSIKEVQAMNLAFNTALYNYFNSIREEVEDIKKHVSTNENLEGSF